MQKPLLISLLLCFLSYGAMANHEKDGGKDKPQPNTEQPNTKAVNTNIAAETVLKKEAIAALNKQLSGINISQVVSYKPTAGFLAEKKVSALVESERDKAKATCDKITSSNAIIDIDKRTAPALNPLRLPMGLSKHFGANNKVILAFSEIKMYPTHAELTAFVKMEMLVDDGQSGSKKQKELFFGASGIKMTNGGKIIGQARLSLLGDVDIPMFKGKMVLTLKGGSMDDKTGGLLDTIAVKLSNQI